MSTLAEIETAIPGLGLPELEHLEQFVRAMRLRRESPNRTSALDLPPLRLGAVLQPLRPGDDLLEEMTDDTRD